jgi:acyl-coenzyme A thioesterase PaaI-like protein
VTDSGPPKIAQSPADFLSLERTLAMSGLEYMIGILEGRIPSAPISRLMGFALNQVASGRIVFRGAPEFDTLNPLGTVHGGWYGRF